MKLTKFAQSTIVVENNAGFKLLIDPGVYSYKDGFTTKGFGKIDLMLITHKHGDHHSIKHEIEIISRNKDIQVYTNDEISKGDKEKDLGYKEVFIGQVIEKFGFKVTMIATDHFAKNEQVVNFGMFIEADGESIYHTSDTRFMETCFYDAELVSNADILCVPISNRGVVMGIDDSIVFTSQITPKRVIPIHYDSPKDSPRVNPQDFVNRFRVLSDRIESLKSVVPQVLQFGETISVRSETFS